MNLDPKIFWQTLEECERLKRAIDGISELLKRPGTDPLERQMLNAERHDLRAKLAQLNAVTAADRALAAGFAGEMEAGVKL
jgi:hypothetical protein